MAAFSSVARLLQQDLRQGIGKNGVKVWCLDIVAALVRLIAIMLNDPVAF